MIRLKSKCIFCERHFAFEEGQQGKKVRCPHCKSPNEIPRKPPKSENATPARANPPPNLSNEEEPSASNNPTIPHPVSHRNFPIGRLFSVGGEWQSQFAHCCKWVGVVFLVTAILSQFYIFIISDWKRLGNLPINAALAAFAALLVIPATLFLTSVAVLAVSHVVELLSRICKIQREQLDRQRRNIGSDAMTSKLSGMTGEKPTIINSDEAVRF